MKAPAFVTSVVTLGIEVPINEPDLKALGFSGKEAWVSTLVDEPLLLEIPRFTADLAVLRA